VNACSTCSAEPVGYPPEQFRNQIGAERLTGLIRHDDSALSNTL
jgi:hypothetical protein